MPTIKYRGLRRERNSISALKIHLVFVTKYGQKVFTSESLSLLETVFEDIAKQLNMQVLEFNGEGDYVHLLLEYPPKLSVSHIVNVLKGVSSRHYGQSSYPKPDGKNSLWSPSYFVSSVGGASIEQLRQYIQNQQKPS